MPETEPQARQTASERWHIGRRRTALGRIAVSRGVAVVGSMIQDARHWLS
ncbi:MAG: hypothetical protein M3Q27_18050 [Actinomycetota bacterium]|nr:hypothetical protein [Actinomycetota bacterium]